MDNELKYLIKQIDTYFNSLQSEIKWFLESNNRMEDLCDGVYLDNFNSEDFRDMYYMCLALKDKLQHG